MSGSSRVSIPETLTPNTSGRLTVRVSEEPTETYPLLKPIEDVTPVVVPSPNIFQRIYRAYFSDKGGSYVDTLLAANVLVRAMRFFPALFITFAIELGNTVVLGVI